MKIRTRLGLWYSAILMAGLLLISGWAYYEMVVEHPTVGKALAAEGHTAEEELGEILLYGGVPAFLLALAGGWFLMHQALVPVTDLSRTMENISVSTLGRQLPRSGNHDEIDRLAEVFNSMLKRLDDSFANIRDFTLNASHELKTPMTIMRGEIETRLREPATTAKDREFFASQLDEIARLTKIVDGLTLLARADAGQLALVQQNVHLDELVRDSFADAMILARPTGVQVELLHCDEAAVQGDRHRLKQLLLNLTDNAIKYNQPGGRITMQLVRNNGDAELIIENTGQGIAPEKLPRVFDRFYRGDPAHNSAIEGSGLGLSIVQWIVKVHGGDIRIESSSILTSVKVRLPICQN